MLGMLWLAGCGWWVVSGVVLEFLLFILRLQMLPYIYTYMRFQICSRIHLYFYVRYVKMKMNCAFWMLTTTDFSKYLYLFICMFVYVIKANICLYIHTWSLFINLLA